jgi:hypothetical protein
MKLPRRHRRLEWWVSGLCTVGDQIEIWRDAIFISASPRPSNRASRAPTSDREPFRKWSYVIAGA